jgi:zinc D-Ala-D-Ala dipeptidase
MHHGYYLGRSSIQCICMTTEIVREYWTKTMDEGADFVERVLAAPVFECGEKLVSLEDALRGAGVEAILAAPGPTDRYKSYYYLREGLIADFLEVCRDFNDRGWVLQVEDAYRTVAMQTLLVHDEDYFAGILEKVVWELGGERPSNDLMFRRLSALIASTPKDGTHMSGSALDISVLDKGSGSELDRGGTMADWSERTPMDSPFISEEGRKNRKEITRIMAGRGFVAYPFEHWHYSKGDIYDALLGNAGVNGTVARYGAIDYDFNNDTLIPIADSIKPLQSDIEVEQMIDRLLQED